MTVSRNGDASKREVLRASSEQEEKFGCTQEREREVMQRKRLQLAAILAASLSLSLLIISYQPANQVGDRRCCSFRNTTITTITKITMISVFISTKICEENIFFGNDLPLSGMGI